MFVNEQLDNYLKTSRTIHSESLIVSEWNMNFFDNIDRIGNYRFRPSLGATNIYGVINNTYDPTDAGNFYTGATDADIAIDGGYQSSFETENPIPQIFQSAKEKSKYLFSLEQCFNRFRPRSGINKFMFNLNTRYFNFSNPDMFARPRYYMPDIDDKFKYWTSYRTESEISEQGFKNVERGVSKQSDNGLFYIDDAVPFVVYSEPVPANRIVVKMQTNVGNVDLAPFANVTRSISDPFFGDQNKTTPIRWKIQYLNDSLWTDAIVFDETSVRANGSQVIGYDGYVEIAYTNNSWVLVDDSTTSEYLVSQLVNPQYTEDQDTGIRTYSELVFIKGLRVVVETMNRADCSFDLIELSPRLTVDLSGVTVSYNISKSASDFGSSGLPVGQLLASNGSISIFDYDEWFNSNNQNSIISKYLIKNMQIKFFEKIIDEATGSYAVPIKTMYAEGFPSTSFSDRSVDIELRDLYFYFESVTAPQIFIPNVSLSYAISLLLDSIGFSNYTYKRIDGEVEPIIPYFYIAPDRSLAEVLQDLAVSTQSLMFFDEYNNFVVMSKNYFMPSIEERPTDFLLSGSDDDQQLSNIIEISQQQNDIYNDGVISYSNKYIQRTYGSLRQAYSIDKNKTWVYKPSLIWEVSGTENSKTINEESSAQKGYSLSAIPLNSPLSSAVPTVVNNQVINNIMDLGESIYWISRYNGYFYANGEIIKYDAVEFAIPGTGLVWISSNREYQNYFSKLKFNGKIYPTGRVRIFSEPRYETILGITRPANGAVIRHGRGQFGTQIVSHSSGISAEWTSNANCKSVVMQNQFLFGNSTNYPELSVGPAGIDSANTHLRSSRSGVIKNFMNLGYADPKTASTVQSSALSFTGGSQTHNIVTYINKPLSTRFRHFGTRMRIIGRLESGEGETQSPVGAFPTFLVGATSPDKVPFISGGGGGLAVLLNPETNNGYYFEIVALSEKQLDEYQDFTDIFNVVFYKIVSGNGQAIPIKLWSGLAEINVDDGTLIGQSRVAAEAYNSVYDISVEYEDLNQSRRFYLYINDNQVAVVDDDAPLPVYNNMALFVRGSSQCMFENVFAIGSNFANNSSFEVEPIAPSVFSNSKLTSDSSLRKHALSGIIQSSVLSGISRQDGPSYNIYYDEFGTIMREASYFKVRYDKAYPALLAQIAPTFNKVRQYTVCGFKAGAYQAEFLLFNATDSVLVLDETTGNYLRIQGVTFTQDSSQEMTLDNYFDKIGSLSDPVTYSDGTLISPEKSREKYEQIRISRSDFGRNEFSLSATYIQSEDAAREMMGWIVDRIMKPRKSVGIEIFPTPTLQLGDIVQIDYTNSQGIRSVAAESDRFVIYNIEYSREEIGPSMIVYLAEV